MFWNPYEDLEWKVILRRIKSRLKRRKYVHNVVVKAVVLPKIDDRTVYCGYDFRPKEQVERCSEMAKDNPFVYFCTGQAPYGTGGLHLTSDYLAENVSNLDEYLLAFWCATITRLTCNRDGCRNGNIRFFDGLHFVMRKEPKAQEYWWHHSMTQMVPDCPEYDALEECSGWSLVSVLNAFVDYFLAVQNSYGFMYYVSENAPEDKLKVLECKNYEC